VMIMSNMRDTRILRLSSVRISWQFTSQGT
jgi:hypothetical protein